MDGGAWRAAVRGVARSRTRLSDQAQHTRGSYSVGTAEGEFEPTGFDFITHIYALFHTVSL